MVFALVSSIEQTHTDLVLATHKDLGLYPVLLTEDEGSDPRNRKHKVVPSVVSAGNSLWGPREGSDLNEPCSGGSVQAEALNWGDGRTGTGGWEEGG